MPVAAKAAVPLAYTMPLLALVIALFFSTHWLRFAARIAPRALERWAADRGYKIVRRNTAGWVRRVITWTSNQQMLYEVSFRDGSGKLVGDLAAVGSYWWPSLTVEGCPVRFRPEGPEVPDDWSD